MPEAVSDPGFRISWAAVRTCCSSLTLPTRLSSLPEFHKSPVFESFRNTEARRALRFGMQPVSGSVDSYDRNQRFRQDLATRIAIHEKQGELDLSLETAACLTR